MHSGMEGHSSKINLEMGKGRPGGYTLPSETRTESGKAHKAAEIAIKPLVAFASSVFSVIARAFLSNSTTSMFSASLERLTVGACLMRVRPMRQCQGYWTRQRLEALWIGCGGAGATHPPCRDSTTIHDCASSACIVFRLLPFCADESEVDGHALQVCLCDGRCLKQAGQENNVVEREDAVCLNCGFE